MSIEVLRRSVNTGLQFNDSVHPLIQKIYKQRTISDADELELGLNNLLTPDNMFISVKKPVQTLLLSLFREYVSQLFIVLFEQTNCTHML